jgi:hypothetical protein
VAECSSGGNRLCLCTEFWVCGWGGGVCSHIHACQEELSTIELLRGAVNVARKASQEAANAAAAFTDAGDQLEDARVSVAPMPCLCIQSGGHRCLMRIGMCAFVCVCVRIGTCRGNPPEAEAPQPWALR